MKNKGFTYIELIIYIAIVVLMMTALIPFAWNIIGGGLKSSVQRDVFTNARFISEKVNYEIRNATGINSVTTDQISLITDNPNTNPTVISVSGGNITLQQGAGSAILLNSSSVTLPSFTFINYSSSGNETKHIQFIFTVASNYSGTRQEYSASTTIEGSAEVRTN